MQEAVQIGHPRAIHLPFNELKATEAAARLLSRHGGRMNYMLLIKLLYLSDREAMKNWGRPITTDRYVAMNNGPVLTSVLDLIKYGVIAEGAFGRDWTATISSPEGYDVRLQQSLDAQELSEAEEMLLDAVDTRFGQWNIWKLVDWMHKPSNIPEWSDPEGTSKPISYGAILAGVGKSPEDIEKIEAELVGVADMGRIAGAC